MSYFHSFDVLGCGRETQLQVGKKKKIILALQGLIMIRVYYLLFCEFLF